MKKQKSLPWDQVEKAIYNEVNWLRNNIETFLKKEVGTPVVCRDCLMREIAILILSGAIKASEIKRNKKLSSFWDESPAEKSEKTIYHGGEWHRRTMNTIENHFFNLGYDVVREPNINWGRADLGIFKEGVKPLYIEIGTTTFFKLCMNLKLMSDCVYLIVPNDEKLIEFKCGKNKKLRHGPVLQ